MGNGTTSVMNMQYKAESADIVIVGNGIAGLTAAVEARRLAPDVHIAIITEQCHPTINTPALKQFAIGKLTQEQLLAYPAGTERAQRIHVINARVESIHAQGKYVCLNGGYGFGYGSLLIATGSAPNGLPTNLPGRDFDGAFTLHCLKDYLNLRRRLDEVDSAVVVGGGAHAIETVMCLLHYGIEVHWLIRSESCLSKILDGPASALILENMRSAGAKVHTGTELVGIVGRVGSVAGVVTTRHKMIPCQLVLACTGTSPITTLAEQCNIPMLHNRGILVDDQFRTNVRDIYAAGDVAARKNPQTGVYETHAQWYDAVLQGRTAAAAMTGHHELAAPSLGVSWHATHLGALYMLTVGDPLSTIKGATILSDSTKKKYRRLSIIDDRLVGYLSLGSTQPDSLAIKRIIDEGLSIRGVKRALLKGDFDVRKYFSQSRSRAAQDMLTSGKIHVVNPLVSSLPVTDPLVRAYPQRITPGGVLLSLPPPTTSRMERPHTEPLHEPMPVLPSIDSQQTIHEWEEKMRPPTDKLPASSKPVLLSIDSQQTIHEWEEEMRPSTDKLPASSKRVVESILVPLPSRPTSRNLWSYSEKIPAIVARPSSAQRPGPAKAEKASGHEKVGHTNFLL
ncbi:MAG: NAD(P)/FAD-dependent oxidoreductase [Ktedonobacteraceae bacterium]